MNPIATASASPCTVNGDPVSCDQFAHAFGGLFLGFGIFFMLIFLVMMALAIAAFVLEILMIVHAAQNDIKDRAMWIIVMVLTGGLGAVIYYFAVKQPYDREHQKSVAKPAARKTRTRKKR